MKKHISMLLAILLLVSFCTNTYAEETEGLILTPDIVMERLEEGDSFAGTAEEQSVNGVYRLAEMLGIAAALRATDEECAYVNVRVVHQRGLGGLALGAMQVFNFLEMIAEQEDPAMQYQNNRESLKASFNDGDDAAIDAVQQTVNALYSAIYMAALILEELCPTEDMIANVKDELNAFSRDDDACGYANDQIVNGAYWLQRMLTALDTLVSPNDAFTKMAVDLSNENTKKANDQTDSEKELVVWLYSCVQMSDLFAERLLSEAE